MRDDLSEAGLDADRLELLDYLLEEEGIETGSESQKIVRRQPRAESPLSFAQQRLWFLDQLAPGSAVYNLSGRLRLEGRLDAASLEASLNEIVRRHEALRTIFSTHDGEPVQIVLSELRLPLPLIDLSSLPSTERETVLRQLCAEETLLPFDLSTGPLVRARLLRLSTEEHVLLLSLHHIVSDGWSIGLLIREVAALYEAYASGTESPLKELSLQYGDYAVWQREWLQGEVLEQQLAYWREQLRGASPVLQLPLDKPRPAISNFHSETLSCNLSKEISHELAALSREEGVTLFMSLLAAFQLLLWCYSGQEDIAVGTPVAHRTRAELEELIGFFVNTLVLRTELGGNPSFRELLQRVKETALGAYAHQDVPFEKLVEELAPERNLSFTPLFQVMFALENAPLPEVEAHGLKMRAEALAGDTAKFDLALGIVETPGGLVADWQYRTELFEAATIERMASHFQTLLEGIVANPDARIADLPLLTSSERHQLLVEWNETPRLLPPAPLVHELFAAHAIHRANAPALLFQDQTLTFDQINSRANQVAHHLLDCGTSAETTIGVMLERGPESLVALLAVFKAGACYLPLDPHYPPERLAFMLADAQASLLITEASLRARLPESAARFICLDADAAQIAQQRTENPTVAVLPQQLAYIIYTSGSTGRPKGVAIEHRQLLHTLRAAQEMVQLTPADCLPCIASFSFDISLLELLAAPLAGGRCLLVSTEKALDADVMKRVLAEATVLHAVPGVMRRFVSLAREQGGSVTGDEYRHLRQLLVGGEAVAPELIAEMEEVFSNAAVRVLYGPTEATIICAGYEVNRGEGVHGVPGQMVGRPLVNVVLRVLDERGLLVPVGVEGEIYVAGEGVARGYRRSADLTAERFVPDGYSACAGARIYRTGDRARYLSDGSIEFKGRTDEQVKVRGFRIEPGEIESALSEHQRVKEAIVVAFEEMGEEMGGEKRLAAYIVAGQEGRPSISELRSHLKERLPDYMIPSAFVYLDALPLSSHGKIDRRALPAPDAERPALAEAFLAPRSVMEEMLASIWSDVLGGVRVGVNDNFFELGGHSLLATQVTSRVREAFGIEIALRSLFEQPTVWELAETIGTGLRAGVAMPPKVERAPREGNVMPLSFAQQRLWFIDQLEPGNPVYNTPRGVRLRGTLDIAALKRALTTLVRRHEALRTTFRDLHGEPVQVIGKAKPFTVTVEDLSGLPEATREKEARRLTREEALRPFDLSTGPLVRARLLRLSTEEHVLLMSLHHIVSDGWSMGVLVREVAVLYEAYASGTESPLKELSLQYADYAVWQREWLQGEVLEQQLSYWRKQLASAPPVLELPTDRPRPQVQTFRGAALPFKLSKELAQGLRALSRREGVTLYMTLLAGLQTLLARYTGQEDISTGTPIANRRRGEIENLIGFFVNTLVLRTDVSGNPTFRELMQRVRETALGAYAHQDVPFEMLVEVLQPERSMSYTPLFQVLFVLQNVPQEKLKLPGLTLDLLDIDSGTAKLDLMLSLEESEEGLEGICEYSTDLFDEATIRRLLGHFETLLEGVVNNPDERLAQLPLLPQAERRQLLDEWNATAEQFANDLYGDLCVHELFARQAENMPDGVAVIFEATHLNYRELNERANKLAHRLRTLGVRPEQVVGVMLERSTEMIVSLLAVLKAGGAYMPLDPEYPQERLAFMLEDARACVVLTQQSLVERLPEQSAFVVRLDTDWETIEQQSAQNPERAATSDNAAYVIYTSGSTGTPKAVVMPHRGAVNLINFQAQGSGHEGRLRTLQFASLSFDVSFQEIFPTLCAGGSLVLLREDTRRDARELLRVITEQRVERLFLPFVALQHLAEEADRETDVPSSLRQIITAGEQLKITPHVARLFQRLDGCTLDNHYGPTETHLATMWRLEGDAGSWTKLPPIGKPIANAQIYVLDDALQPVPVGVTGELYIGGTQLARGYLNRPEQTAERFIPHPFDHDGGGRLYRTGDLARYSANGVLEYAGRRDLQVKVRGFRVEVGEIEAALKQHGSVKQAVVTVREDEAGRKRLVAYIVAAQVSTPPGSAELRRHLKHKLPEYMIPSLFLRLDALPLTNSGKVDRRALPAPDPVQEDSGEDYVAPRSMVEEMLASIWSDVLGGVRVGVNDNFFELGGHSLLATQVMSRVREAFGIETALRSLFEQPTVGELAETIGEGLRAGVAMPPPVERRVERAPREGNVMPLSFAQQRMWFLDKFEQGSSFYNLPATVRICGATLNVNALEKSLRQVTQRHEILRTTFTVSDGQPVQVISPESHFTLPLSDLGQLPTAQRNTEAQRLAREEARRPFDLSTGPLMRARLLRLSTKEHVLLLSLHHVVSDGWSMGLLIREVAALYEAYASGTESPLKELSLQYGDYAVWQREWLQGEVLEQQLAYWRKQLAGLPPVLELPTDYPRPAVITFNGAAISLRLPRRLSEELKALSRGEGVTLFMSLLAAFQLLLWRYSGQEDIAVGTPVAHRTRAELEELIGFFVNTLVLRTELGGNPSFRELLQRVKETALGAYAHQDVPFEKLVEELAPERNLSFTPLFQVIFAMENTPSPEIELRDLQLSVLETERETAKFDITLVMWETAEGLEGSLEYNTDLYEEATMQRLLRHFQTLLEGIVTDPDARIADLPLLTPLEQQQLLNDWNDTRQTFRQELCIHELFELQAEKNPNATAVVFEDKQVSYKDLNARANRLAHQLRELGVGPEMRVGVLMERSFEMVLAVLSVLKAGGTYVPLDPAWPLERLRWIASSFDVGCVLTEYAQLRAIHELQWKLPYLTDVICLDVETQRPRAETLNEDVVRSFWNRIAEQSVDDVTAGGFISSYTGRPFAESEVREYVERVADLAQPFLGADRRVLEIGCGSGLIMFELAPHAGLYVGLDPSDATQTQNLSRVAEKGSNRIKLATGFAGEIDTMFEPEAFDLIVMASTAQFFPGPNYFEAVLEKSLKLLAPGGTILLCDIMDARHKQEFGESLQDFQRLNPQARTRTQLDGELYFDEAYFFDLKATFPGVSDVQALHREQGFSNELGYRFDVILKKDLRREDERERGRDDWTKQPSKRLWTNWHLRGLPESNPSTTATSANVAYIIFTSGSTGQPKGVMVQHRSIINLIEWVHTTFKVGPGDRLLFVTSLTFDLSVYDIFGTLAAGATIYVASRADLREPQRLARLLCEQQITFWDSAPVALQQLTPYFADETGRNSGEHLRVVFLAGDWIPLRLPDEVHAAFLNAQVVNLGGATETSVYSNFFIVGKVEPRWASIPYGKPIYNARYHILDAGLNPVPIGVPGDIYAGGDCLSLGYTDAMLTAERFIPDPFSAEGGARLYTFGDRGRYRPDGEMEFFGRRDSQVKIRGFRIELGEIEAALVANRAVREVVVIVREDVPGEKRLVGYIVPEQQPAPTTSELHSFLKDKLPAYMLPSAFVMLDALPLTPNGKLNRRALPAPHASRPALASSYLAPATELERRIAEIWQEVLGVDRIGMRDNFFELGGHSLLLVQMHARLNETLQQEVSIIDLFKYPTIASLAAHLGQDQRKNSVDTSNRRRAAERREALKERSRPR